MCRYIVKLLTRRNRLIGNKEYLKWYVEIPPKIVKKVKWEDGMEIELEIKNRKITLKPKNIQK